MNMYEIRYDNGAREVYFDPEAARESYFALMNMWRKGILCNPQPSIVCGKTESRIVNVRWNDRKYVEIRFIGEEWSEWYFAISDEKKENYIYMPEFGVWRCNISSF